MSSTRTATDGVLHQERFCSAPEFEGETINGLAAAKRIALIDDPATRELLWFIQWRSLAPSGLRQLADALMRQFADRIGTPALRKLLRRSKPRSLKHADIFALRRECGFDDDEALATMCGRNFDVERDVPIGELELRFYQQRAADAARELPRTLINFCLNPKADLRDGVWFFDDLHGALIELRNQVVSEARSRLAATAITEKINGTLDFWYARKRMVLIEGAAGTGRTASARAWVDANAGMVRLIEVPSSSDDRSFFSSIARQLGVARATSMKAQQIKVRIEEMLAASELMLAFDESQYLWGQYIRPRKTPDRLLWIKTIFDAGTAIALIAHTDFSKWQKHYVERTLWTDEQFERRLNRRVVLPAAHSERDMLTIARAHFPQGDQRSLKLLASYALGTEKRQASGIVEALESARFRAERDGRNEATFADIKAALTHDHSFLKESAADLQSARTVVSEPVQARCKRPKTFAVLRSMTPHRRIAAPVET